MKQVIGLLNPAGDARKLVLLLLALTVLVLGVVDLQQSSAHHKNTGHSVPHGD